MMRVSGFSPFGSIAKPEIMVGSDPRERFVGTPLFLLVRRRKRQNRHAGHGCRIVPSVQVARRRSFLKSTVIAPDGQL